MSIHIAMPLISWVAVLIGALFGIAGIKCSRDIDGGLGDIAGFYLAMCCFLICALFWAVAWGFAR